MPLDIIPSQPTSSLPAAAVFTRDDDVLTNSRTVAEVFEKRHADVLRAIDDLLETHGAELRHGPGGWFRPVTSPHPTVAGRLDRSFDITRDGLTLLAMGFNGQKALRFKMLYIEAFNRMEAELRSRPAEPRLDDPNWLRSTLLCYTEKVIALEGQVAEMTPKAAIFDTHVAPRTQDTITRFCRTLAGVNTVQVKARLKDMKYLWKTPHGHYRVRSEFRDTLFVERLDPSYGTIDIFVTPAGRAELVQLLNKGLLPLKASSQKKGIAA